MSIEDLKKLPLDELSAASVSYLDSGEKADPQSAVFLCQAIAGMGIGWTSPNPCVGSVICSNDGEVLGYGWHRRHGEAHAEKNAIENASTKGNKAKLSGATIYVSLEPCNHQGSQPPCCSLIVEAGIKRVVYVWPDPNRQITENGKPTEFLAAQSVDASMAEPGLRLQLPWLDPFIKSFSLEQRPYICLKAAVDPRFCMGSSTGEPTKITGARSQRFGHFLRQCFDGILVGRKTLLQDRPQLSVRTLENKNLEKRDPAVFVAGSSWCDKSILALNKLASIKSRKVIASCLNKDLLSIDGHGSLIDWISGDSPEELIPLLLKAGKEQGMQSILVEGGSSVQKSMYALGVVDRLFLMTSRRKQAVERPTFFPIKDHKAAKGLQLRALTGFDQELVSDFH